MGAETTTVPLGKTRFLTWEKQEHLVKLAILIIAAVLCEYKYELINVWLKENGYFSFN